MNPFELYNDLQEQLYQIMYQSGYMLDDKMPDTLNDYQLDPEMMDILHKAKVEFLDSGAFCVCYRGGNNVYSIVQDEWDKTKFIYSLCDRKPNLAPIKQVYSDNIYSLYKMPYYQVIYDYSRLNQAQQNVFNDLKSLPPSDLTDFELSELYELMPKSLANSIYELIQVAKNEGLWVYNDIKLDGIG